MLTLKKGSKIPKWQHGLMCFPVTEAPQGFKLFIKNLFKKKNERNSHDKLYITQQSL